MSISPRFLDEIRSRLNLSDVIGARVRVTRAGREFKACCPFHKEKTPSFTINDDKQFYHCFGCGAHGDVIGFVMHHDGLSFIEAVELLSAQAGLQMPKPDPQAVKRAEQEKGLHELMGAAADWFQARLEDEAARDILAYAEQRGLNEQARVQFRIGYAPADGQALRSFLRQEGFSDAQMIEAGVLKTSTRGGEPYVFFRERLMFPVADRRGRVVAFGGRILPESLRAPSSGDFTPPKYINTADTPLFDKGRMLYGESFARQAVRDGHSLIVMEGYMDVIAAHMAGFKGAVAPMGTALTDDQILSLWSMNGDSEKVPVLCFDGDNAGRKAAGRACDNILPLLKAGQSVRFAFLPEGEDPDSLLRSSGRGALQKILAGALSLFDFIWFSHTTGRSFDTPEARAGLSKALMQQVATIKEQDVQQHYKALVRARISEAFFKPAGRGPVQAGRGGGGRLQRPGALRPPAIVKHKDAVVEKVLLAALLNYPALYDLVEEAFGHCHFSIPRLEALRLRMIALFDNGDEALESKEVSSILAGEGFAQEISDILCESVYLHAAFCRPDSLDGVDLTVKAGGWSAFYETLRARDFDAERTKSWRDAVLKGDEAEEGRLKTLVRSGGVSESGF
ncbi:MAG: DNA primase [Alphaproteobacteria bacterium]|nr:DNA primase [Alphaproteobacteria bacterium]